MSLKYTCKHRNPFKPFLLHISIQCNLLCNRDGKRSYTFKRDAGLSLQMFCNKSCQEMTPSRCVEEMHLRPSVRHFPHSFSLKMKRLFVSSAKARLVLVIAEYYQINQYRRLNVKSCSEVKLKHHSWYTSF